VLGSGVVLILLGLSAILVVQLAWKSLLEGIVVGVVDLSFSNHSAGFVVATHFLLRPVVEWIRHIVVMSR
jgi:hypothetical protein